MEKYKTNTDKVALIHDNAILSMRHEIKTIKHAIISNSLSVANMSQNIGEKATIDYLSMWILKYNKFVNNDITKQMSIEQIEETALLILDDYFYLKLSDIYLIFKEMKLMKHGKIYGNLSGLYILQAFADYTSRRITIIERLKIEQKNKDFKEKLENGNFVPMPEKVKKKINEVLNNWTKI